MGDYILGFVLGTVIVWSLYNLPEPDKSPQILRSEYKAYRTCIQVGPKCTMTVQDYVRYYQLKELLEETDEH